VPQHNHPRKPAGSDDAEVLVHLCAGNLAVARSRGDDTRHWEQRLAEARRAARPTVGHRTPAFRRTPTARRTPAARPAARRPSARRNGQTRAGPDGDDGESEPPGRRRLSLLHSGHGGGCVVTAAKHLGALACGSCGRERAGAADRSSWTIVVVLGVLTNVLCRRCEGTRPA
jgi:hypothetical protein